MGPLVRRAVPRRRRKPRCQRTQVRHVSKIIHNDGSPLAEEDTIQPVKLAALNSPCKEVTGVNGTSVIQRIQILVAIITIALSVGTAPNKQEVPTQINNETPRTEKIAVAQVTEPAKQEVSTDQTVQPTEQVAVPEPVVQAEPAPTGDVESIVRQAARKFGIDENHFVQIARCESGLNPNAVNYGYNENGYPSGLFQHISGYWPSRASDYGWAGASVFNAQANAEVTAQMFRDGLTYMWECR